MLFPGGEVNLESSAYYSLTKKLYQWAVEANMKGDFFPVLGICRGMQALAVHTVGNLSPLSLTDSKNFSAPLKWMKNFKQSGLLVGVPDEILKEIGSRNVTSHFHKYGITPKTFNEIDAIRKRFQILATSKDRNGKEFVSIFEGNELVFIYNLNQK